MNKFLYSHRPRLAIILYKQSSTIASSESIQKKKDPKYVLSDQYTGENKLSTTKRLPRMQHLYILYLCIDVDDLIWRSFARKTLVVSVKKLYNASSNDPSTPFHRVSIAVGVLAQHTKKIEKKKMANFAGSLKRQRLAGSLTKLTLLSTIKPRKYAGKTRSLSTEVRST